MNTRASHTIPTAALCFLWTSLWANQTATSSPASQQLTRSPSRPTHWLFFFYFSGTERTTIIIIHHTIVRVEPDPMTAIQGGEQRESDSPPTPIIDSSGMTQTLLMGGLLSPVTLPATRRPLWVPHKATGGATTQTRTTNVFPTPSFKDELCGHSALQKVDWPWRPHLSRTDNWTVDGYRLMCLTGFGHTF